MAFSVFVLAVPLSSAGPDNNPKNRPDLGAFEALEAIPADVDAAAVFDNPAESILLSPVGRSMRLLLAGGGVFTQTEHAWEALGEAFDTPVDQTIRALLSRRVVVVWDGFERGGRDMQGLTDSIDSRWALICQVDPGFMPQIRDAMRPVKRNIVHGRAVYAIEQGRYRVVMLEGQSSVLLAPSSGTELLHNVLGQIVNNANPNAKTDAITSGHHVMLAQLNNEHALIDDGSWSMALMARTDVLFGAFGPPTPTPVTNPTDPESQTSPVLAAMVKLDTGSMRCSFASDIKVNPDTPDAPIALLDAIDDDAVFTMASGRSLHFNLTPDSSSVNFGIGTWGDPDRPAHALLDAPSLITLSPIRAPDQSTTNSEASRSQSMGISITLVNPRRDPGQTALLGDETVRDYINAYDPSQAPSFGGRLPDVARSITVLSNKDTDQNAAQHTEDTEPGWLEDDPNLTWLTASTKVNDLFIATITPHSSARVDEIRQAALTLDALDAHKPSGVLLRSRMFPAKTISLLGNTSLIDLALAKLVHEIELEIRRGLHSGIRGSLALRFGKPNTQPKLGGR